MFGLSPMELALVAGIALLLWGSKLPEKARELGGHYRGLKKNLSDFQREFNMIGHMDVTPSKPTRTIEEKSVEPTTPKFLPPPPDDE